jgi:chitin disaccharide deacetylase
MVSKRSVVLCADDFGLTDGVSRGILELAEKGRVSATGAMTNMPGWRRNAPGLRALKGRIATGLHLTLTAGSPLGPMPGVTEGAFPPLNEILRRVLARQLPADAIRREIARQLDAFAEVHGAAPDFVDGHQHVHVLPVVRRALLAELKERGHAGHLWLRDPSDSLAAIGRRRTGRGKALVVKALAAGFRRNARAAGFDANEGFSGFAPYDLTVPPPRIFADALAGLGRRPVVMCHPGHADAELRGLDPAVESREAELTYLGSEHFAALLEEQGVRLVPSPTSAAQPHLSPPGRGGC